MDTAILDSAPRRAIGICLGASTLSIVTIETRGGETRVLDVRQAEHGGDPQGVLSRHLDDCDLQGAYLGATGRKFRKILAIPSITEPEATEYAFAHVNGEAKSYDAIVSAGAESFIVYQIDGKGRISRIGSGNKCASGTGEFFLQQSRRMNVPVQEAVRLARTSTHPHELSARCSVFCKSDCTHALNKGEPIADVAAGLARMLVKKIEELLVKCGARRVLLAGGTTRNDVVVDALRRSFELVEVPVEATYFEALGAALWAMQTRQDAHPARGQYYREAGSSFSFHQPIASFAHLVDFKEMPFQKAAAGDECIVGLDVGSTTTKAVLLRTRDETILSSVYLRTNGNPVQASRDCYSSLAAQLADTRVHIIGLGVTGSGRYIAGLHAGSEGIINEIIAHARAAAHFDPSVDTIYEIGGQDAKYTYLTNSVASDYAMNEACSAGTGSFLEESARETLGIRMEDIADIALKAIHPPNFSDQCAAFISSDINTALQEGVKKEDVVAGLVYSICINYANRVRGSRHTGDTVFMQGGVCYNRAVPIAMAGLTGRRIVVPPHPGIMGAYGVALELKNMITLGLLPRGSYDLAALAAREVAYGKSFICQGKPENCDRKCEIAMISVEGRKLPFGGACNKYYNRIRNVHFNVAERNHVETRSALLFRTHAPARADLAPDTPVVGINRSFHTHTLYSFYHAFFTELGCRVILPEKVHQSGIDKGMTSYCLSGQIALGMFEDLLEKRPDYIFMPQIKEMHVSEQEEYRIEYQSTCMFVQGEPWYQRATFLRDALDAPKLIAPVLNFMNGFDAEEKQFVEIGRGMGFSAAAAEKAHRTAVRRLSEFFAVMKAEGRRILAEVEADPQGIAVVLFGRPYNAFTDEANKGVPFKFASRGVRIIPYDFLPFEEEENFRDTYWEMGQKIIKAARIVKRHPQLYGCYITNFLCALDSMMVPHFRDLMKSKPSLTLEVDSHTADAGVNTRIEAFLDVVRNYRKMRHHLRDADVPFTPACTEVDQTGKVSYVSSDGSRLPVRDPRVKVIIPSMGNLFSEGMAAVFRGLGWHAQALPVCDREALDLGRSVSTSKECLPIINILGGILKYLKHRADPEEMLIIAMVDAGGCCRVGQYEILIRALIEKKRLRDVALLLLSNDDGYAGLGIRFRLGAVKAVYVSDVMDDVRSVIKALAVDRDAGMAIFDREAQRLFGTLDGSNSLSTYRQLRRTVGELSRIALRMPVAKAKYVGVVGEIFVRRDHFSLMGIPERLAEQGFVMLDAPVSEWVRYTDFLRDIGMYTAKHSFIGSIEALLSGWVQNYHEHRVKRMLARSGLYEFETIDIKGYLDHSTHFFPLELTGEPGLSSGSALHHFVDKYCGTISVGPFGCMNSRMTEAVATVEMTTAGKEKAARNAGTPVDLGHIRASVDTLPFLSVELDGNVFSQIEEARFETFMLQANRLAEHMEKRRNAGNGGSAAANN
jgi:predicted CoA-substrate-specific enzyme activase